MRWVTDARSWVSFRFHSSYTVQKLYCIQFFIYTPPLFMSLSKVLWNHVCSPIAMTRQLKQSTNDLRGTNKDYMYGSDFLHQDAYYLLSELYPAAYTIFCRSQSTPDPPEKTEWALISCCCLPLVKQQMYAERRNHAVFKLIDSLCQRWMFCLRPSSALSQQKDHLHLLEFESLGSSMINSPLTS